MQRRWWLLLMLVFGVLAGCKSAPQTPENAPDPRACASDLDCDWRRSGCFEECLSKSATVEAPNYCGAACAPVTSSCSCISGRCTDVGGSADGGMPHCGG